MNETNLTKQIVSVTEMARMCGLSRARFYQLMNDGIFPSPSRNPETNRPFFDQEQQEQCLQVRRTNQGANGKAVMFYGFRAPGPQQPAKRKRLPNSKSSRNTANRDPVVTDLRHGLTQLGITGIDDARIRQALIDTYPDGHLGIDGAELLRTVFARLSQEDA
jgi:predicted DNA-binding transcriptional regulator AlpA